MIEREQSGSALLGVLILASAGLALTAGTAFLVRGAGRSVAARHDALCAHFAATGAVLAAPGSRLGEGDIDPVLKRLSLRTANVRGHCVLVAQARCGRAVRSRTRDVDPEDCGLRVR